MISRNINEPIILSSKPNKIRFYFSLLLPILMIGLGLHEFIEDGQVLFFLAGIALFTASWFFRFKNETYITHKAVYQRVSSKKYETFRLSDLSYACFEDDVVYCIFGEQGDECYSISNDANNFEEIRAHLEQLSQKHLPYHRYEFALRSEMSFADKLGCLDCASIFGFSGVINWTTERTRWSFFSRQLPEIAVCPSCKKEGRVIVSRTGLVTPHGLKSMNRLYKNS
ncbi:hypothetical protein [Robiginitomaculum antarcticum]|uniref:hypothetical protein n=1 Tax=Robiginitomaculum antarcticum TaxID=437507 RepID=UPI0003693583|nr:hypothetical protein [Robiginitomaculum antarcticum]